MFVTAELLKKLKACKEERDQFTELFPFGVELSRAVIVQYAQEFNWTWCAENLAGDEGWAAYDQAERSAWAAYRQAVGPTHSAYKQAIGPALAVYQQDAYQQAEELALAAYP